MSFYFDQYSSWEPNFASHLTYAVERPGYHYTTNDIWMRCAPGPRTRIIIEGKNEYVERLHQAMSDELAKIREEIP